MDLTVLCDCKLLFDAVEKQAFFGRDEKSSPFFPRPCTAHSFFQPHNKHVHTAACPIVRCSNCLHWCDELFSWLVLTTIMLTTYLKIPPHRKLSTAKYAKYCAVCRLVHTIALVGLAVPPITSRPHTHQACSTPSFSTVPWVSLHQRKSLQACLRSPTCG